MAFMMEQVARGAKASVDTRYAEPRAAVDFAQQQATLEHSQQLNELGKYDVQAARTIADAATQQAPVQEDYSKIYGEVGVYKQKQAVAKQKLDRAESLYKSTMASGKFSETTRKAYDDAKEEYKTAELAQKQFQAESLRKVLDPAMAARDQSSWDMARPKLAQASVDAAVQAAIEAGVKPDQLERLKQDVMQQTLQQLPEKWGPSAQNFIRMKAAELKTVEDAWKMDDNIRKEEKHKVDLRKVESEIRENNAQASKAVAASKNGGMETGDLIKTINASKGLSAEARQRADSVTREIGMLQKSISSGVVKKEELPEVKAQIAELQTQRKQYIKQADTEAEQANLMMDVVKASHPEIAKKFAAEEAAKKAVAENSQVVQNQIAFTHFTQYKSKVAGVSSVNELLMGYAEENPTLSVQELLQLAKQDGAIQ